MNRWMKIVFIASCAVIGVPVLGAAGFLLTYAYQLNAPPAGQITGRLVSDGETRTYVLHVPPTYDPNRPTPLVISIHGFAGWPAQQMRTSRWNDLADQEGFLVVYPKGTSFPLHWRTQGPMPNDEDPLIDVHYISALIDSLSAEYNIDPARIYANGHSNGGGMSDMLACTLADRIAAIGTVSGAYLYPRDLCNPDRPVPVISFHGTADPIVPYNGGPSGGFHYDFPVIPEWAEDWAIRDGCDPSPESLPPFGSVTGVRYGGCRGNAEVILHTIAGGGHTWPGGEALPIWITGPTTQDINATDVMWEFFMRHPMAG